MTLQLPPHLNKLSGDKRVSAVLRFKLKAAALYATEKGTLIAMADRIGVNHTMLSAYVAAGRLPADICLAIETLCGRDSFPREWFEINTNRSRANA